MKLSKGASVTSHPFFSEGNGSDMEMLRDAAEELVFQPGQIVFEAGSESDGLYLVVCGTVEFQAVYGEDEYRTVSTSTAGEYFGEIGVLTGQHRSLRAVARTPVTLARLPATALTAYMRNIPGPIEKLVFSLVRHLHETTHHYLQDMVRQEKMALVGTMVNTIIHDFKNPFCMISLGAQMLAQRHNDEQTLRLCRTMEEQVQRMVEMAGELSEFSKGRQTFTFRRVSLQELMERFKELNFPFFERPGVNITIDVPDVMIDTEPQRLIRVFQNLVGNALDALPNEQGRIDILGEVMGRDLCLRITDTGQGIPLEIRESFWEPFVTHGKRNGTGLGSAIIKSIVEAHQGTISFESRLNEGTTFTIQLPLRQMESSARS